MLRHLAKGHTSADVAEAFELMEQAGISLRPSLMPFSPWETLESYIELLRFFEDRRLIEHADPAHFSIRLLVPPVLPCSMRLTAKLSLANAEIAAGDCVFAPRYGTLSL